MTPAEVVSSLAAKDKRYADLVARLDSVDLPLLFSDPPRDCPNLGRELTGPERTAARLDHGRRWALCLHPDRPLGPHVCPCRGCNPTCRGYGVVVAGTGR